MKPREVIRLLERDGWRLHAVKGSHYPFKHPAQRGKITVPVHNRDLPPATLASILKQAGVKP
jgi:predicted RNA binding protein YcfA (HicA-like mRNA interferase family)